MYGTSYHDIKDRERIKNDDKYQKISIKRSVINYSCSKIITGILMEKSNDMMVVESLA